jgi:hypothetical protein
LRKLEVRFNLNRSPVNIDLNAYRQKYSATFGQNSTSSDPPE